METVMMLCRITMAMLLLLPFHRMAIADNLALLTGTLRTYHRVGCETQSLALTCPTGTIISVQSAQYTPGSLALPCSDTRLAANLNNSCSWPQALQYSLLQSVVEACQKKQQCRVQPSVGKYDPCPGHPKFIQVDYKCRPFEFRSKVACENEVVNLQCNPNSRLAMFSASYGRTEYESIQCPQPQGVPEETCLVSYATETVMTVCHGKRNCRLAADAATFGNPCKPASRMYLKVVYNCVPRRVLKEQFEEPAHSDEPTVMELDYFDNPGVAPVQPFESLSHPANDPRTRYNESAADPVGHENSSSSSLEKQDKFYLYLGGGLIGGLLSILCVVAAKYVWQRSRRHLDNKHKSDNTSHDMSIDPNAFGDNISEVDADIDLTDITQFPITVIPTQQLSPSEVVRYGNEGIAPKSLCRNDSSQYYYG
ncbi:protein eva-1 homolog C isoform X2 [Rhopalosiphum maidis]|uniref:protein eva-1 homolog C isoform X2 n=1 Tax=Rhopalosiphum maidis TaxID=43146 RepID=UPI000F00AA51|nr:protein eva-1 homolog C isoform X2 [Rhopalosiphum maidis]